MDDEEYKKIYDLSIFVDKGKLFVIFNEKESSFGNNLAFRKQNQTVAIEEITKKMLDICQVYYSIFNLIDCFSALQ